MHTEALYRTANGVPPGRSTPPDSILDEQPPGLDACNALIDNLMHQALQREDELRALRAQLHESNRKRPVGGNHNAHAHSATQQEQEEKSALTEASYSRSKNNNNGTVHISELPSYVTELVESIAGRYVSKVEGHIAQRMAARVRAVTRQHVNRSIDNAIEDSAVASGGRKLRVTNVSSGQRVPPPDMDCSRSYALHTPDVSDITNKDDLSQSLDVHRRHVPPSAATTAVPYNNNNTSRKNYSSVNTTATAVKSSGSHHHHHYTPASARSSRRCTNLKPYHAGDDPMAYLIDTFTSMLDEGDASSSSVGNGGVTPTPKSRRGNTQDTSRHADDDRSMSFLRSTTEDLRAIIDSIHSKSTRNVSFAV